MNTERLVIAALQQAIWKLEQARDILDDPKVAHDDHGWIGAKIGDVINDLTIELNELSFESIERDEHQNLY